MAKRVLYSLYAVVSLYFGLQGLSSVLKSTSNGQFLANGIKIEASSLILLLRIQIFLSCGRLGIYWSELLIWSSLVYTYEIKLPER
jgi:hypothetical protein